MKIIGVEAVEAAGKELQVGPGELLTPLARDRVRALGVKVVKGAAVAGAVAAPGPGARRDAPAPGRAPARLTDPAAPRAADARSVNTLYHRGLRPAQSTESAPGRQPDVGSPGARNRVSVIGAGHVGSIAALRLAESDLFGEVLLVDVLPGRAAGIALDLWHDAGLARFASRVVGTDDLDAVNGSAYVVVTAGKPRQPGMTRTDLTAANAAIVGPLAERIARVAPDAVLVIVSNPLEEMTHLAQRRSGFPASRVLGMAGVLDSARFCSLVALTGICRPEEVRAYALGSHGPEMVIPLSQATISGKPLTSLLSADQIDAVVERTRDSGAEVVKLLQSGSAYFAPGHAAALMVTVMATESDTVLACAVDPAGAYGISDTRVGLPVRLGRNGLRSVETLDLTPAERTALVEAADRLRERIHEVA